MITFKKKNYAKGSLDIGISDIASTFALSVGQGAKFPDVGAGNPFRGVFWSQTKLTPERDPDREIVEAYRDSGDDFVITQRGAESTIAKEWEINDNFALVLTAGVLEEVENEFSLLDESYINLAKIGTPTYGTLDKKSDITDAAVSFTGGGFTDNEDGTIGVAAGSGMIRATDSITAPILAFDWEASTSLSLIDAQINYIYAEYNAGSPRVIATTTERTDLNTNVFLGLAYREGTKSHIYPQKRYYGGNHPQVIARRLQGTQPFAWESGAMVGETGTRNITITPGAFWEGLDRFTTNAVDTSGTDKFSYYYKVGENWTKVADQTQIDNVYWNNTATGLVELTANRYGVHWVFLGSDSDVQVVYGQGDYTLALAQAAKVPSLPPVIASHSRLIGKIIIQKNASVFTSIESAFTTVFAPAPTSIHNELSGLQGGAADEYYHATAAEYGVLQNTVGINTGNESTLSLGVLINGADAKATPVNDDMFGLMDSAASNVLKKLSVANLLNYLNGVYEALGAVATHAALTLTHGVSGAIVGTTNTQTLTNKTLTAPVITVALNDQTDSYTLVLTDAGKLIDMNKATANTLTVPTNATVAFAIGTVIFVRQKGAGATTIAPAGGVTINSAVGLIAYAQFSVAGLMKLDTDTWAAFGDLKVS